jgi:hypothetical protein
VRDYTPGITLRGEARDTARRKAARMYEQGATVQTIANELGRCYSATHALLVEAGVAFRPRGGSRKKAA